MRPNEEAWASYGERPHGEELRHPSQQPQPTVSCEATWRDPRSASSQSTGSLTTNICVNPTATHGAMAGHPSRANP